MINDGGDALPPEKDDIVIVQLDLTTTDLGFGMDILKPTIGANNELGLEINVTYTDAVLSKTTEKPKAIKLLRFSGETAGKCDDKKGVVIKEIVSPYQEKTTLTDPLAADGATYILCGWMQNGDGIEIKRISFGNL